MKTYARNLLGVAIAFAVAQAFPTLLWAQPGQSKRGQARKVAGVKIEWVHVPAGNFEMGSHTGAKSIITGLSNEEPVHQVEVPAFDMAKSPVTVGQYRACVAAGICAELAGASHDKDGRDVYTNASDNGPVEGVSRKQAETFASWVEGRLPSEAEWEYSAKNHGDEFSGMVHFVNQWVQDDYHDSYKGAPTDGKPWIGGPNGYGIVRGGNQFNIPEDANPTRRMSVPLSGGGDTGIRLVKLSYSEKAHLARVKHESEIAQAKERKRSDEKAQQSVAQKDSINKVKRTRQFRSFREAEKFLGPIFYNDGMFYPGISFFLNPMATKGRVMIEITRVLQIIDHDTVMLGTPQHYVVQGDVPNRVYFARINPNFTGDRQFDDTKCYAVVAEVTGARKYTTTRGFEKTVPEVFVYAIGRDGVDESEGPCR